MRVLFVSQEYPPETGWGGIGSYVASIAPALAARGHEVHVLSCVAGQPFRDYLDEGVHIHRRGFFHVRGLSRLRALFVRITGATETWHRLQLGLSTLLEWRRLGMCFDVVEYPVWNAEGWLFALKRHIPLVALLVTPAFLIARADSGLPFTRDARWSSVLEKFAVERAHVVNAPSRLIVDSLRGFGWLKTAHVEVVPPAVHWSTWETEVPVSTTAPVVLFIGRLEPRKAPELLADALSIVRNTVPNAQAIFVGRDGRRDGLLYRDWLVKRSSGASGLRFMGSVPWRQLMDCLASSRVLAMPSISESFGLVAAEAMAAGRPVVTTTNTGIAELVQRTGSGSVVPPGDAKALAQELLPFLTDASLAEETGERGRTAVKKFLDPATVAEQHEAVCAKAIALHAARRAAVSLLVQALKRALRWRIRRPPQAKDNA